MTQARRNDPDRQRHATAQLRQLGCFRLRYTALAGNLVQQDYGIRTGQHVQGQLVRIIQTRQLITAGHQDQAALRGGQQRTHLSRADRIVQDNQGPGSG
jgi:hypothetical protein